MKDQRLIKEVICSCGTALKADASNRQRNAILAGRLDQHFSEEHPQEGSELDVKYIFED